MEGIEGGGAAGATTARMEAEATHAFRFGGEDAPVVRVRELGELGADDPSRILGTEMISSDDRTGLQLWAASLVLSRWLVDLAPRLRGRGVIELGAGCGLCGIVAAKQCGASPVILSDLASPTMDNMRHNLALNGLDAPHVVTASLDWRDKASYPAPQPLVIGADLVYAREAVGPLTAAIDALVAPGGAFLYVCPETNRQGEAEFLQRLCLIGFECQRSAVPPSYLQNAFAPPPSAAAATQPAGTEEMKEPPEEDDEEGFTEEDFFILFSELQQRTYTLYCYTRMGDLSLPPLPQEATPRGVQPSAQPPALPQQQPVDVSGPAPSGSVSSGVTIDMTGAGGGDQVSMKLHF